MCGPSTFSSFNSSCCSCQDNFLVSGEGHVLMDGFGPGNILTSPAKTESFHTSGPYALRFHAPELEKEVTRESMAWSFGCLLYEVFYPPATWTIHLMVKRCFRGSRRIISTLKKVIYSPRCHEEKFPNAPALLTPISTRSTTNSGI